MLFRSVFSLLLISFIFVHHVDAGTSISSDIKNKILTLDQVQSITALLVSPTPNGTTTASITTFFKKGLCPQSIKKEADVYTIQTINTESGVPKSYIPKGLVDIRPYIETSNNVLICMTEASAQNLYRMSEDMKKEQLRLVVVSGYRSYTGQQALYNLYAPTMNAGPYHRVAPAGHSEHQLGTTVDVSSEFKSGSSFSLTDESQWIQGHAHLYGFILSYEEGSEEKTGYMYEPWHLRYVGVQNATLLRKGQYSLAYKPIYYKSSWINNLLGRLKDYVLLENSREDVSIGG